jgi:DNA repair protein RecO (recombination protein O)
MKPHSYTSEGIVLARRNFGEADRILVLYSKSHGKVSLIAKGVRRPKSRKRGHIEVFNKITFQATSGRGIDIMTEAEVIEDFKKIRKNLSRVSLAYYFCEVIGKITHDGESNIEVYNLVVDSLEKLKETKKLKSLRLDFVFKLLTSLGYWPRNKPLLNADQSLEEVIERNLSSMRVGKILSS